MKKLILKIFLCIVICATVIASGILVNNERYKISEPMPDLEYKKEIIRTSHNPFYRLENLRKLVGEEELTEFIKQNDKNPQIYDASDDGVETGKFRATLHNHTLNSDGVATVKDFLAEAQMYSEDYLNNAPIYIAITDHNTTSGAKELIETLQKYPNRYKNVRVIAGMEIFSKMYDSPASTDPVDIHVLAWCINPYDKFLNKEFKKTDKSDRWNKKDPERSFQEVVSMMKNYGMVGIAHPALYSVKLGERKFEFFNDMLNKYKKLYDRTLFYEGYYQSYPVFDREKDLRKEYEDYVKYINKYAESNGIIRTGSTDAHGTTIFNKR